MYTILTPAQCKGLNCFDACLINHVNTLYQEYACTFSNAYYFVFNPKIVNNQIHMGLSLHRPKENIIQCKCHEYYGIHAQKLDTDLTSETLNKLIEKKQDIIIIISTFWCPWSDAYQKYDIEHAVIILNQKDSMILCADPMLTGKLHEMPVDHFIKGCKKIFTLHSNKKQISYEVVWQDFIHYMKSVHIEQAFKDFIYTLVSLTNIDSEFPTGEISLLDRALSYYLPGSRKMLHCFMQHMYNKFNNYEINKQIAELPLSLAQDWELVRAFILRAHYKQNYTEVKTSVFRLVESIMEKELRFVNYFQN